MKRVRDDSEGWKRGVQTKSPGDQWGEDRNATAFRKPESTVWEPTPINGKDGWGEKEFSDDRNSNGGDRWATEDRNQRVLRNKMPDEDYENQGAKGRSLGGTDIFDRVEGQSSDSGSRKMRPRDED